MIEARLQLERESGFSLDVELKFDREITALYGPSGAGKTTILRLLAGLEPHREDDRVTITSDGVIWQDATHFTPPHQRRIGYVFQQPQLFPHLTVKQNLLYGYRRAASTSEPLRVIQWLDLEPLLDKRATALSGGEAQRVAIGRVLLYDACCILMDEPLGSVDQVARMRILPYLDRLHAELAIPLIYVSHSMEEVNYLADHIYLLRQGSIRAAGSIFDVTASLEVLADEGESLASVVLCDIRSFDDHFGLVELGMGTESLFVTSRPLAPGRRIRVRIPARDVSITLERGAGTSILNILHATILDISQTEKSDALVRLAIGDQSILARITRKSVTQLKLHTGMPVFAQIKGVALMTQHVN